MRKTLLPVLTLLALTGPAMAETVTVVTTLGERGLAEGFLLSGRRASSFYLPLPAGAANMRIGMKARAVVPNLQRGSVVIIVNGQPVDALRLSENPRARIVLLDTVINEGGAFRAPALDLRFRADLIAHAEFCADHFDPADTLQVLPETTIAYDVDLNAITTLKDALALLPGQPEVEVALPLTPGASAAALKLSAMLAKGGYRARFTDKADADAPAGMRLVAPSTDGTIRLEYATGRLRIDVPENADIAAFARLWQAAPLALSSEALRVEGAVVASSDPVSGFWPFPALPEPLRVVQTGELGLDFPMLDGSGRRASQTKLRLTVAPDWSDANPVITLYLNGQLIAASRAEIGENILTTTLPADLLRLSNRLSVTVDRAHAEGYCPGPNPGHAVQLLPGTGIDYEGRATGGFAVVAGALRQGGTLVLPEAAKDEGGLAYLTLASRVLSGLGVGAAPVEVRFGETSMPAGPILSIAPAGADGLVLPMGQPDVTLSTDQPLASLTADADRQRLDIRVLEGQEPPDPAGIYLGNGSAALVGPEGVIWQDTPAGSDPSILQRARELWRGLVDVLRTESALWGLIGLMVIAVVVVMARALLKRFSHREASK
ncbi:hypothetical protein [Devosia sp.]|uniref:hypothetical protein n=1 Tax=Devosia sp. TaxID=1871048 RepID=UPI002FCA1215